MIHHYHDYYFYYHKVGLVLYVLNIFFNHYTHTTQWNYPCSSGSGGGHDGGGRDSDNRIICVSPVSRIVDRLLINDNDNDSCSNDDDN